MKTNGLTRGHLIAYIIAVVSLIALFFTNRWEVGFHQTMMANPFKYDFTARKAVLFVLNLSLLVSITRPLNNEDERVEKIKNYVRVHIFFLMLSVVLLIGLFFKTNVILLAAIAIIQVYYIVIFWVCIYRDPVVLYISEKQAIANNKAQTKKFKSNYIMAGLLGITIFILTSNNRYDLVPIGLLSITYVYFMIGHIYTHWQN